MIKRMELIVLSALGLGMVSLSSFATEIHCSAQKQGYEHTCDGPTILEKPGDKIVWSIPADAALPSTLVSASYSDSGYILMSNGWWRRTCL